MLLTVPNICLTTKTLDSLTYIRPEPTLETEEPPTYLDRAPEALLICSVIATAVSNAFNPKGVDDLFDALWLRSRSGKRQSFKWYCGLIEVDWDKIRQRIYASAENYKYQSSKFFWGTFQEGRTWTRKKKG